jgi:hypothetical protein
MELKLDKLEKQSGKGSSIYSFRNLESGETLFDEFIKENISHISELKDIIKRITTIGTKTGARENFFKLNEGKPGDGVCALYDIPASKLRLYCIRYGTTIVILGGGGPKPKDIRALQENDKLTEENYLLRTLSEEISIRIKNGDIEFINDGYDFDGDLNFSIND